MMKAAGFFLFISIGCAWLVGMVAGGGGVASTYLTAVATEGDTTLTVNNADIFASAGKVSLGMDMYEYTNATAHTITLSAPLTETYANGSMVYTDNVAVINYILGFNLGSLWNSWNLLAIPLALGKFFGVTIPYLASSNMGLIFKGDLAIIAALWAAFGGGFVFMLIWQVIKR